MSSAASAEQLPFAFENDREYAERMLPRLIPIARRLGAAAFDRRVIVAELRAAAMREGVLTGRETGKRLSFLHQVMPRAGAIKTGEWRRSNLIEKAHGNLQQVWYFPHPPGLA